MNNEQLNAIIADNRKLDDLVELMRRKIEIQKSIDSYSDDLDDIKKNAEALGVKAADFNELVKMVTNPEITLNKLVAYELVSDHIINKFHDAEAY